ncbi:MAG: hypothetical protein HFE51_08650 [Clostridia bacterium]|nr:hypothetical protein [Clostridia bacterium]MCI9086469.1 hypothetical protein [Clostridia bacterium]
METQTENTLDISDVDNMDGYEFEEFCCRLLEFNGYTNVINTQASGDYGLDIIATTPEGFICGIQCKNYQGSVGIEAVQQALSGINYYKECNVAVVLTNSTFTKQAIQMADETNVKLWDRDTLIRLMRVSPKKEIKTEVLDRTNVENNTTDIENIDSISTDMGFLRLCFYLLKQNEFTDLRFTNLGTLKKRKNANKLLAKKDGIRYTIRCISGMSSITDEFRPVTEDKVKKIIDVYNEEGVAVQDTRYYDCNYSNVILTNGYFTRKAVDLARENNILLWDRNKFIELLNAFPKDYIANINSTYRLNEPSYNEYRKFRNNESMTDDELKKAVHSILKEKGCSNITELPVSQQDILFIGQAEGNIYGVLVKNSTVPVKDDVIVRARKLWDECYCDEMIVMSSGGFTDEARKESCIASYRDYSEEEMMDMIGFSTVVKLWDNKTQSIFTKDGVVSSTSNTPHLGVISIILSIICLIIVAISGEISFSFGIIGLIVSGISVARYALPATVEAAERSEVSRKLKLGAFLSIASVLIMAICLATSID